MKKILAVILSLTMILSLGACTMGGDKEVTKAKEISMETWNPNVKDNVNAFLKEYGKDSEKYQENSYVVFDFDNTCSIFDLQEQLAIYQLEIMAFAFTPDQIAGILETKLGDLNEKRGTEYCEKDASYADWISDIKTAYEKLWETYGPFDSKGLSDEKQGKIHEDENWKEFSTKMRAMYDLVYDSESAAVAYPWVLYWFTGMSEEETYNLAKASHEKYKKVESEFVEWKSPENMETKTGVASYKWTKGVQVTENIKELMAALKSNGIKVWVCSASATDNIKAGIDVWGLHDLVDGVIAMTNTLDKDGKYINEYDYKAGYAWIPEKNGKWSRGNVATEAQTWGDGKVKAIDNVCVKEYGQGPLAGFMDSTGDYGFCTEYKNLQLVICFNRASRKVTDGGGVVAELAVYQKDNLGYDFAKAQKAGDTLYVLQGRDENGMRTLRNSEKTIRLGNDKEQLFRSYDEGEPNYNQAQLDYMIKEAMTTKDIIDKFAIKTPEDSTDNLLGFKYGFFKPEEFHGYHSK